MGGGSRKGRRRRNKMKKEEEEKEEIIKIRRKSPNSRPTVLLPRGNYCYKFLYPSRNFLCIYK